MSVALGIDIGTSYFSGAFYSGSVYHVYECEMNLTRTPSFVAYVRESVYAIGHPAKANAHLNSDETVYDIKKILGRKYSDPLIQNMKKHWSFSIEPYDEQPIIKFKNFHQRPEDVQCLFYYHVKKLAEKDSGHKFDSAVVAVPVHFDDDQRRATINSCKLAGLNVLKLINEPTAAAVAFCFHHLSTIDVEMNMLVFDMGSTTTATIIAKERGYVFKIRAISHDDLFGGDQFDNIVIDYILNDARIQRNYGYVKYLPKRLLKYIAEQAKVCLSTEEQTSLVIDVGFRKYSGVLTREVFEQLCGELLIQAQFYLDDVLKKAMMQRRDIAKIIVSGGASKMPMIQRMLSKYWEVHVHNDCHVLVAGGAAVHAAMLTGHISGYLYDLLPISVLPNALGINDNGTMLVIVKKGAILPCVCFISKFKSPTAVDLEIIEGEEDLYKSIGFMMFGELASMWEPEVVVDITFSVDIYCVLTVTLKNETSDEIRNMEFVVNDVSVPFSAQRLRTYDEFENIHPLNLSKRKKMN